MTQQKHRIKTSRNDDISSHYLINNNTSFYTGQFYRLQTNKGCVVIYKQITLEQ